VAQDHYFTRAAVAELAAIALGLSEAEGEARAAAFRDRIGTGRKLAIQILEFFDRLGYSRRIGDGHRVFRDSLVAG
jgi:selenocysteine-specific elongation factor